MILLKCGILLGKETFLAFDLLLYWMEVHMKGEVRDGHCENAASKLIDLPLNIIIYLP